MDKYSTDNVSYKAFQPHGAIDFSIIDGNIILYQATGPFNKELFLALEEIEPQAMKQVKKEHNAWCEVVVFVESCLALEEFLIELTEYMKMIKKVGLAPAASAYVISDDTEGSSFMKEKYKQCYEEAGLIFSSFDNTQEAIQWAKSYLPQ